MKVVNRWVSVAEQSILMQCSRIFLLTPSHYFHLKNLKTKKVWYFLHSTSYNVIRGLEQYTPCKINRRFILQLERQSCTAFRIHIFLSVLLQTNFKRVQINVIHYNLTWFNISILFYISYTGLDETSIIYVYI